MPSLHDRGGQCGGGSPGVVPEEQRQFPFVAEPHPLPLEGHQERPCKCATFSRKSLCTFHLHCANLHLPLQDCLRSCQEQIESLLESSLRQAQQHSISTETKRVEEDEDLSCTPTDVRDINI